MPVAEQKASFGRLFGRGKKTTTGDNMTAALNNQPAATPSEDESTRFWLRPDEFFEITFHATGRTKTVLFNDLKGSPRNRLLKIVPGRSALQIRHYGIHAECLSITDVPAANKGDNQRPSQVPKEDYDKNYDKVFGKEKKKKKEEKVRPLKVSEDEEWSIPKCLLTSPIVGTVTVPLGPDNEERPAFPIRQAIEKERRRILRTTREAPYCAFHDAPKELWCLKLFDERRVVVELFWGCRPFKAESGR
jgi:hypothetical protein